LKTLIDMGQVCPKRHYFGIWASCGSYGLQKCAAVSNSPLNLYRLMKSGGNSPRLAKKNSGTYTKAHLALILGLYNMMRRSRRDQVKQIQRGDTNESY